ncbi:thiamine pyrophosphate-binding protein [Chelatococcus reniformis]|uniref:Thiamine pyrophosphate protein n=1 Tax=Chelatococcus reniformis TaxID=1494448 RepID=A0A916UMY4_9HYPH|nr:thiamine pyrophosphate-binding protein [Chelatococcus reniformis]GGC79071.1 thiamine pyrophosphate protein [Chelatococcus reniformis]
MAAAPANDRSAAAVLVDQLVVHGARHVFCVPGESYLAVLDAFHDAPLEVTICRQEGGAAMMAEAVGKLTGRPGLAFVTRGPGATNASPGLHIAAQDSTPMILFVGQVGRRMRGREAFQELDYQAVFGTIAKWVVEIDDAARIPELVSRAFHVAMQGRPGPVVVALPEDMLRERVAVADAARAEPAETHPGLADMADLQKRLWRARAPVVLLGGSRWTVRGIEAMGRFATRFDLPVAVSFRRQMLFPAAHPCFAGDFGIGPNPRLLARVRAADLLLLVGARLSEMPSQSYSLLGIPEPGVELIHVHPDAAELNKLYRASLAIQASPAAFCAALEGVEPPRAMAWAGAAAAAHGDYLAWSDPVPVCIPGSLQMGAVMAQLRGRLPADAVLCNGAGNYATWVHRFWPFGGFGTQLAPTSGSMGYGVPAAVAAKRLDPARTVVAFAGDGCFLMNGQEFATAVQHGLAIVVIVVDNGMYGTIRMHQEREYPGRVSATALTNPDFAALARAYGGHGETVRATAEFAPALERALAAGGPAIIHCLIDPEAITPTTTLTQIHDRAIAEGARG